MSVTCPEVIVYIVAVNRVDRIKAHCIRTEGFRGFFKPLAMSASENEFWTEVGRFGQDSASIITGSPLRQSYPSLPS